MNRFLAGGLLVALGCAPFPPTIPVIQGHWAAVATHPAIGCWALTAPGIDTLFLRPPGLVRLTDSAAWQSGKAPHSFVLIPGPGVQRRHLLPRFAAWAPTDSAGRIRFGWGDGFVGIQVTALVLHDSLVGRGHRYTDFRPPNPPPDVPVTGFRVPCDSVAL